MQGEEHFGKRDGEPLNEYVLDALHDPHMQIYSLEPEHHHGTIAGYNVHKCRCNECKRAKREYMREYMRLYRDRRRRG